jgi:hypothetical protein
MFIYIILYTFLVFAILGEKENNSLTTKRNIIFFYVIIFTLFRGLRWDTGTDWDQYYEVFLDVDWNDLFSYDRGLGNMEPGYVFLNLLIKSVGGNYTLFLLITNLFVLIAYARFSLTNSESPIYIFVLIMFSTQFFPVRIGIAVAIILFGLFHFSKKKYFRVIVCTIIAMSFHSSAIIFLPVYFISFYKKIPTTLAVVITVGSMILVQSNTINTILSEISFIYGFIGEQNSEKFEHYLDYTERGVTSSGITSYLNSIIFILTLILFGYIIKKLKFKEENIKYTFVYNMYFIFVLLGIIFSSENMANLRRTQNYFMFAFPILFSEFIVYGRTKQPRMGIVFTTIFIMYLLFRSYTLFFSGFPDEVFPYISIFESQSRS